MSCGAKTRSGLPCKKPPLSGRARCRLHGGASLSGENHWNFRHGRCTKDERQRAKKTRYELKALEALMYKLGMIAE